MQLSQKALISLWTSALLVLAPVCSIWWWYSMRQERMVRASGQTHI